MPTRRQPVALAVFFLSGAAGLVYQVVWSRLLNEVFGVSAHATTAVLATYLGGLALGGWVLGRTADRAERPLRLYGLLELGVGATAVAGAWLVRALEPAHAWAASRLAPDSLVLLGLRVLLASAVVLPPTFLMGATLPAMSRAFVDRIGRLGRTLAILYGVNTAGAVAGCVAAGFLLIRAVGVHPTLWLAVGANLLVGAAALVLSRSAPRAEVPAPAPAPEPAAPVAGAATPAGGRGRWLLAAMALSGFASLSLEVVWTRMLVLVLGTSTYAFATMLASFLVGIALGSWLARPLVDRLANTRRAFGWIEVAIAATTVATLPLVRAVIAEGPHFTATLGRHYLGATAARFALSFLVMIVPTTLIGATFPLAARIWARELHTLGGRLGQVYGANTLGNVLGALAGGFVLLPVFGVQRGIALLVIANLAAAGLALFPGREAWRRPRALLGAAPVLLGLWACAALLGAWRPDPLPTSGGTPLDPLRYYREGLVSTVSVFQRSEDGRQLVMKVDGITIGQSVEGVDRKQQFLAHAPFLLDERPLRNVLSIGLGTGILVGEVAKHPGLERVTCVELSPSVIEGARRFAAYNGGILDDPRARIVNDDGVGFLRRSRETYDAIISDGKSIAGHAGNGVFYSQDYYRSAREHLAPGGSMIQWVPLDVSADDLRVIVRTFTSAFPHAYLWLGTRSFFLVGLLRPLTLDLAHVQAVLGSPAAEGLRRHGWRDASEIAALLLADRSALSRWVGDDGPVNSLERPILEFHALDDVAPESERVASNLAALAALGTGGVLDARVVGGGDAVATTRAAVGPLLDGLVRLVREDAGGVRTLEAAIAAAPAASELRLVAAEAMFELARSLDLRGRRTDAAALYDLALGAWPELVEGHVNRGRLAAIEGRTGEAEASFLRALQLNPLSGSAHAMLGRLLQGRGDSAGAVLHLREAIHIAPLTAALHEDLGLSLALARHTRDALAEFREALRLAPDWPAALDRVALLLATTPEPDVRDPGEAVRLAEQALKLTGGKDPMTLEVAAAAYASAGRFTDAEAAEQRTLEAALATGDVELAGAARAMIELYRKRLPLPSAPSGAP